VYTRALVTAPASEPVTLTQAKAQLRVDHSDDDALITQLITTARQYVEIITSRALLTQTWDVYYDEFPDDEDIDLPFGQLQSVVSFSWTDSANVTRAWTVSGSDLFEGSVMRAHINTVEEPACIELAYSQLWPTDTLKTSNPIRVRITCGYVTVPSNLTAAMLLLIDHWYRNTSAVIVGEMASVGTAEIPMAFGALIANYRLHA
jgi:uncharacterized phiE125 gp8 family phage protein